MGLLKILKTLALVVAAVAVTIGVIGKVKPELFLKFSPGFILWAMTGHPVPPYIVQDAWQPGLVDTWLKDEDLVVASGAKSGTTWMLYCTHQIRTHGDEENFPFEDPNINTPWMDLISTPGANWATQLEKFNTTILPDGTPYREKWDHDDYPFRIFKSHFTPRTTGGTLPVKERPNVRFLAVARPGLDVFASFVPFFNSHTDEWRAMWGGFPPRTSGDFEQDKNARFEELMPGGLLSGLYFNYVNNWWPLRNEDNVMLLHYNDIKKDLTGTIAKIAKFVNIELTEEELETISQRCSFDHMKSQRAKFNYQLPLNPDFPGSAMVPGTLVNKGQAGRGKNIFSEEQKARYLEAEVAEFGHDQELLEWIRHGTAGK